jgi:hypothetical protein
LLLLALAGCSDAAEEREGQIVVREVQEGGGSFVEGAVTVVRVKAADGSILSGTQVKTPNRPAEQLLSVSLPAGTHRITAFHRACSVGCTVGEVLGPREAECSTAVRVEEGQKVVVTIRLRVPNCTLSVEGMEAPAFS